MGDAKGGVKNPRFELSRAKNFFFKEGEEKEKQLDKKENSGQGGGQGREGKIMGETNWGGPRAQVVAKKREKVLLSELVAGGKSQW